MKYPTSIRALTDSSLCPRCLNALTSTTACTECGFPLDDPRSRDVLELSRRAAEALSERGHLLVQITEDAREAAAHTAAVRRQPDAQTPVAQPSVQSAPPQQDRPTIGAPSIPRPATPPEHLVPDPDLFRSVHGAAPEVAAQSVPHAAPQNRSHVGPPIGPHAAPQVSPHAAPRGTHQASPQFSPQVGAQAMPHPQPAPQAGAPTEAPPAASAGSPPSGRGVQLLLLVLGVGLLTIAAGFYLVYAWFTFDIFWRAVSTLAVTLVAAVGASWLRRARLRAGAEGVAALASALIVLDVWAIPALGIFGLDRVDQTLFWGCALIALALVFEGWSRITALRFPAIAASLAVVPGIGLAAAGLAGAASDGPSRFAIGAVGATLGALIHLVWRRRTPRNAADTAAARRILPFTTVLRQASTMDRTPEIVIVAIAGLLAAATAFIALVLPFTSSGLDALRAPALLVLAVVSAAHAVLIPGHTKPGWLGALAVPFAPIAIAALLAAPVALRGAGVPGQVWAALAGAVAFVVPAVLEVLRDRRTTRLSTPRRHTLAASRITGLVGLVAAGAAAIVTNAPLADALIIRLTSNTTTNPLDTVVTSPWAAEADGLAIGLLLGSIAAALISMRAPERRARIAPYWVAATAIALAFASWQLRLPFLIQAALIVSLGLTVATLILVSRRTTLANLPPLRTVLWIGSGAFALLLIAIGAVHAANQTVSAIAIVAALLVARLAIARADEPRAAPARVGLTAGAAAVALITALSVTPFWTADTGLALPLGPALAVALSGAVLTSLVVALPRGAFAEGERTLLVGTSTFPALIATVVATLWISGTERGAVPSALPQPVTMIIVSALLAAVTVWGAVRALRLIALRRPSAAGGPDASGGPPTPVTMARQADFWLLSAATLACWAPVTGIAIAVLGAFGVAPSLEFVHGGAAAMLLVALAVIAALVSFLVRRRVGPGSKLWFLDAPALALGGIGLIVLLVQRLNGPTVDLAVGLALMAVLALLVAGSSDGLVSARDARKHVAWAATPLAAFAWLAFVGTWPVSPSVEGWWLPVGAIVAVTGVILWWFGRVTRGNQPAIVGPVLVAAGLLVGGLPSAVVGGIDESPARALIVAIAASALLLVAVAVRLPGVVAQLAAPGAAAVTAVLVAATALRASIGPLDVAPTWHTVMWTTPALVVVAGAAALAVRNGVTERWDPARRAPAIAVVGAAAVVLAAATFGTSSIGTEGGVLAAAAVALIGASIAPVRPMLPVIAAVPVFSAPYVVMVALISSSITEGFALELLLLSLIVVALANVIGLWRLRHEHPAVRAASIAMLPPLAVGTIVAARWLPGSIGNGTGDAIGSGIRNGIGADSPLPFPAVGAVVAIIAVAAFAALDLGRHGSARRVAAPRLGGDAASIMVACMSIAWGTFAGGAEAALGWAGFGAVLVIASVVPRDDAVSRGERLVRSGLRWVGTPIAALGVFNAVPLAWPTAPGAIAIIAAGALVVVVGIVVAVTSHRSTFHRSTPSNSSAAGAPHEPRTSSEALVELTGGAFIALVGSALVDPLATESGVTHLVVAIIATLVLTAWASRLAPSGLARYGVSLAAPAAIALAFVPVLRSLAARGTLPSPLDAFAPEVWGVPVFVILIGAAALGAKRTEAVGLRGPLEGAFTRGLVIAGIAAPAIAALIGVDGDSWWRSTIWIVLLSAVALVAHSRNRFPLDVTALTVATVAIGLLTLTTLVTGNVAHIEQLSIPLGASAVIAGVVQLRRSPPTRSWVALAPGIVIVLLPSFIAQLGEAPLWRIVGVGLVAVGALVWGLLGKLQAAFLLGLGFTVAQAITAFWIALGAANREAPWWIWLAIAGLVLLVLAIRFEASMRDAKKTVSTIAAMR